MNIQIAPVKFHNLTFGNEIENPKEAIYVMNAVQAAFEYCHFSSNTNTMMYAMSNSRVHLHGCVLEGQSLCSRFLCLATETKLEISNSYVANFLSFCTVLDPFNVYKMEIKVDSCYFEDVQDGIRIVVHPASDVKLFINKLNPAFIN